MATPFRHPADGGDALFADHDPANDPEGVISKFVHFECTRLKRDEYTAYLAGSLPHRLHVLMWYLTDYVRDRGRDYIVPLSRRQLDFLNAPAPISGDAQAISVAMYNFVLRERSEFANLLEGATLREAVYWWCVERAPSVRLDHLITPEQIAFLLTEENYRGEEYALTTFMAMFWERHDSLHHLDLSNVKHRAAYFHYLLLLGFRFPSILRLLPQQAVRKNLHRLVDGNPLIDSIIAKYAIPNGSKTDGSKLRMLAETVHRMLVPQQVESAVAEIGIAECLRPTESLRLGTVEHGVNLIGPVDKMSGLGQAARLSLQTLKEANYDPGILIFDMDNPAPVDNAVKMQIEPIASRRAVNLIHLNAESVPLAFAYSPRELFCESYNIGYFFWELDLIPRCHRLALDLLDEIWVSSEFNREIYSRYTDKPVINVGMAVAPADVVSAMDRRSVGLSDDSFVFLATFDSFSFVERKNPLGTVEAFRAAFPLGTEPVQLLLKTQNRARVHDPHQLEIWQRIDEVARRDQRIVILNETMTYADLIALKAACDAYVSLHRAEGWGFGIIEAMRLGLPVIATGYSGNLEFCTPETAHLVDYDLVPVRASEYIFVEHGSRWAQPQVASAARRMRDVFANGPEVRRKTAAAATLVKQSFSPQAIAGRYRERLEEIARLTAGRHQPFPVGSSLRNCADEAA